MKSRFKVIENSLFRIILISAVIGFAAGALLFYNIWDERTVEAGKTDLKDMQYTFRAVSEKVLPVVVEIKVTEINIQEMPEGYSWPFNFIEPEDESSTPEQREYETNGLGSGVIVKKDKNKYYVITNNHVIGDADKLSVVLNDDTEIDAEIVGTDERKDIALISFISEEDIDTINLGNSDELYVGDWVLAVGSPLGYDQTVTAGIVSAIGRNGPEENISDFIQTDASINQGNSGGALVNLDGELVGINTWIATTTGVSIGLGFSIPVNNIKASIEDLIRNGSVLYGWLGVTVSSVDSELSEQLGLKKSTGTLVYNVYEDSPAWSAGLMPGDFIYKVNGINITDYKQFTRIIGELRAGDEVGLEIVREGEEISLTADIELRKTKEELISLYDKIWPGFTAVPIDSDILRELGLNEAFKGVIIKVDKGSRAFKSGLKDFDIITEINGNKINNMLDFYSSINDKSNNYDFKIIRNNNELEINLVR